MVMGMQVPGARVVRTSQRDELPQQWLTDDGRRVLRETTKKLVKQNPKPKTLEEAVDKATEIDNPIDNVAQHMIDIGRSWAIAPSRYVLPMSGTTGETNVIPGISGASLPTDMVTNADDGAIVGSEIEHVALFTNPQGGSGRVGIVKV
ncbi:hypothetical protein PI124_g18568 [Phytophthora idaei]|nr:hypothetical protein PI124_g18568 [Phytophthora idaei]